MGYQHVTAIGPFRWKREAADIKSKHPDVAVLRLAGPPPRKTIIPECDQSAERARRVDVGIVAWGYDQSSAEGESLGRGCSCLK